MPTYEYACKSCGEHLEVVQSFKDDALTVCPNCEGELRKVFSAAGLIFKGSGWHVKDYASSSRGSSSSSATSDASSGSSSSTGGSSTDGGSSTSTTTSTTTSSTSTGEAKSA